MLHKISLDLSGRVFQLIKQEEGWRRKASLMIWASISQQSRYRRNGGNSAMLLISLRDQQTSQSDNNREITVSEENMSVSFMFALRLRIPN